MDRFRSKPTEIEAIQWTGDNYPAIYGTGAPVYLETQASLDDPPNLFMKAGKDGAQGGVPVPVGHWIVRNPGDDSDWWPVDPDYFAAKYELCP